MIGGATRVSCVSSFNVNDPELKLIKMKMNKGEARFLIQIDVVDDPSCILVLTD